MLLNTSPLSSLVDALVFKMAYTLVTVWLHLYAPPKVDMWFDLGANNLCSSYFKVPEFVLHPFPAIRKTILEVTETLPPPHKKLYSNRLWYQSMVCA